MYFFVDCYSNYFYYFFQHIRGALGGGDFKEAIEEIGIGHLFLVGGFSESPILQDAIREEFKDVVKVIIPQVNPYL